MIYLLFEQGKHFPQVVENIVENLFGSCRQALENPPAFRLSEFREEPSRSACPGFSTCGSAVEKCPADALETTDPDWGKIGGKNGLSMISTVDKLGWIVDNTVGRLKLNLLTFPFYKSF